MTKLLLITSLLATAACGKSAVTAITIRSVPTPSITIRLEPQDWQAVVAARLKPQ